MVTNWICLENACPVKHEQTTVKTNMTITDQMYLEKDRMNHRRTFEWWIMLISMSWQVDERWDA
jgi:hypothetical protein